MNQVDLKKIKTEERNPNTMHIDLLSTQEIVEVINKEDQTVAFAVEKATHQIARLIDVVVEALYQEGRLIYVGAGTSGRIGILDAVECRPTFSVSDDTIQCLMAGGINAMVKAVEGAEDSKEMAVDDLKRINIHHQDVVVGLAASGRTPYVIGAVEYAKKIGCKTGCVTTSSASELASIVDFPIEAITGAEPLTGSTRMKSGTAQKMICNIISTTAMIKMGKVYENLMIDLQATNIKLVKRAQSIVCQITGVTETVAQSYIERFQTPKKALFALLSGIEDIHRVNQCLDDAKGHLRNALKGLGK